ncbi:hypothetical protein [Tropicimonas sediminicola]|uniref:Uncharacterized protein n=1 Tax=Tropicimonas sediminicola TaxID=1031541 RepID=A0A239HH89_9RHOB|nr:hypothetical protein [Tropicimonas sediminicola]SNS80193.1 hypothetical protein SAMN05421757_103397 [Tropicimonas sediminicola]
MKILELTLVAGLVLTLPVALGGQAYVDFGDHGAAYAKNGDKGDKGGKGDRGDKGNNGRGSDKSKSGKDKSDKTSRGAKGASGKSDRSSASKSQNGNNPFAKLKEKFGKGSSGKSKAAAPVRTAKSPSVKTSRKPSPTLVTHSPKPAKRPGFSPERAVAGGALASQLKSLNSLNRNINGLMNSSDPKMAPFRDYVMASADSEAAKEALEQAQRDLLETQTAYDQIAEDLALPDDPDAALTDLDQRLRDHAALEPEEPVKTPENADTYDELLKEWETAHKAWEEDGAALTEARDTAEALSRETDAVAEAEKVAEEAADAVSEEVMRQAMVDSLNATGNGPVTEDDITPEMEDWVAAQLGVGEADGLIDDYIARQQEEMSETDTPETAEAEDSVETEAPEEEAEDESTTASDEDGETPEILAASATE